MKNSIFTSATLALVVATLVAHSQGTFIYDQQSVPNDTTGGEGAPVIQANGPVGQSFTPLLPGVGFVRLFLFDLSLNGIGATIFLNLRSDSMTGPILGSTQPVFMADGFTGRTNFFFPTEVAVSPGTTYIFELVVQSGDNWRVIDDSQFNYPGGTAFGQGLPAPPFDLWFREGIIVPEPSTGLLGLIGSVVLLYRQRTRPRPKRAFKPNRDNPLCR